MARSGQANLARPYLGYAGINRRQTTARSRYSGFLTQFRHEGGRLGTVTLNYTLSRNRATASNDRDAVGHPAESAGSRGGVRGCADRSPAHLHGQLHLRAAVLPETRPNPILRAALGGWQMSGITTISPAPPLRVSPSARMDCGAASWPTSSAIRGRASRSTGPTGSIPAAFTPPADGTYGNSTRAPFRLPGRNQTDLALSKNFYALGQARAVPRRLHQRVQSHAVHDRGPVVQRQPDHLRGPGQHLWPGDRCPGAARSAIERQNLLVSPRGRETARVLSPVSHLPLLSGFPGRRLTF